ncbi:MAG TPA: hypothetical protein VKF42_10325 [Chitinivibrionales bacterium]|jgi:hypothetical protein|nr:hypothetical protein [Chitinivibrionales bacterium]
MGHCRKERLFLATAFLAFVGFVAPASSAPQVADTGGRTAAKPTIVPPAFSSDTSLIVEDRTKAKLLPPSSAKASSTVARDSGAGAKNITGVSTAGDTLKPDTREMFRNLGRLHKGMGIFTVAAGAIAVIAGASILEKQDILPFSLSLITIGGIAMGLGAWEIKVGWSVSK